MAHFAEIVDGVVARVLVIDNAYEHRGEDYLANELGLGGEWVQTSYSGSFRGKFAGVGDVYDPTKSDRFFTPGPYPSWTFTPEVGSGWSAPTPMPDDGGTYVWNEEAQAWIEVTD